VYAGSYIFNQVAVSRVVTPRSDVVGFDVSGSHAASIFNAKQTPSSHTLNLNMVLVMCCDRASW